MKQSIQKHLDTVLHHLYINPLEKCNLKCKICYTRKTSPILSAEQIMVFLEAYQKAHALQTITFCGGEVFALAYFPQLVNTLVRQGIFIQVITNGTIDTLDQFENPNAINLIVSLDGLANYHDANRGEGSFQKSLTFLEKAKKMTFHTEIFSIVTRQNLLNIDSFEEFLHKKFGDIPVTYHPRKPPTYLLHHPVSNIVGQVTGFDFLTPKEMVTVMRERTVFPPKNLGCYQIALMSDGKVYGCCEGVTPLGTMYDPMITLFQQLKKRVISWEASNTLANCLGCSQPDFMCGIKEYLTILHA